MTVTADPGLMRRLNKALVLNVLRTQGPISRADLSRLTHLSRSTISAIAQDLLDEHMITDMGEGSSSGGRPPMLLSFNWDAALVAGIELGASHITLLLTNLAPTVIIRFIAPFSIGAGPEAGMKAVSAALNTALQQAVNDIGKELRFVGAGVGVPGPVDWLNGSVVAPPIMPGWDCFPFRHMLSEHLGAPVYLDNDANLGALGEYWYGAGQGVQALAFVKVGTGVGCGFLINGQVYRGENGFAGEIGHVTVMENGPPCKCGSYGCLEAVAGGDALAHQVRLALLAGHRSSLSMIADPNTITTREVAYAAAHGDSLALQTFQNAGRLLGIAIADMINLFNPGRVLIGGGVSQAADLLLDPLRQTVNARAMHASAQAAPIMPAALGGDAVALGAVAMVLQNILQGPAIEVGGSDQLADLRHSNLVDPAAYQPADCLVVNAS